MKMNYLFLNVLIEREDQEEITAEQGIDFVEKLDKLLEENGYAMSGAKVSLVSEKNKDIIEKEEVDLSQDEESIFMDDDDDELDNMLVSSKTKLNNKIKYN
jgi:pyridoxine 5'-phosphate synthase PdxJ